MQPNAVGEQEACNEKFPFKSGETRAPRLGADTAGGAAWASSAVGLRGEAELHGALHQILVPSRPVHMSPRPFLLVIAARG